MKRKAIIGLLYCALPIFLTHSMEDKAKNQISEPDRARAEVRDCLVKLEEMEKKLFGQTSAITRGYQIRIIYATGDAQALQRLKRHISKRLFDVTNEYCNKSNIPGPSLASEPVTMSSVLERWQAIKDTFESKRTSLSLREEGYWRLKIGKIENTLNAAINNCSFDADKFNKKLTTVEVQLKKALF